MGKGTSAIKAAFSGDIAAGHCSDSNARNPTTEKGGKTVSVGTVFIKTVRHFFPQFNEWIDMLPDSRFEPFVEYDQRFLLWWGILLFCCNLGSRRQLDFELRDLETSVLDNVNRLAGTHQNTLPVHKTLPHYLGHIGSDSLSQLRTQCIRRLIRMKALDDFRLHGAFVIALDGTGHLKFNRRHCEHCLTQEHEKTTVYLHQVLEAKLIDTSGMALSIATEFIENTPHDLNAQRPLKPATHYGEKEKQDCELKAFARLAPVLKKDFPQTPLCISGDSIYACGTGIQICKDNHWSFIFTFKPGRTSTLWEDFQGLLKLNPNNSRGITLPTGIRQRYRWVNGLPYEDSEKRRHILDAIICEETTLAKTSTFAWITDINVNANNVIPIATKGGRGRFTIENEGFNTQKNGGYNLEHAYSFGQDTIKSFYYLLQIAHLILQLVQKGSLLKNVAEQYKTTPGALWGSLKNIARRLLECFRCFFIPDEAFDHHVALVCQIRFDSG